jgi:hypothetical protein
MVKKFLAILLLLVYTAASSGTVMSAHYCMGEFAGISIGEKQQEQCGYCGMDDAGCCHDLLQVVKIDDSQLVKTSLVTFDYKYVVPPIKQTFPIVILFKEGKNKFNQRSSTDPPGPPVYLRNCVFRI